MFKIISVPEKKIYNNFFIRFHFFKKKIFIWIILFLTDTDRSQAELELNTKPSILRVKIKSKNYKLVMN